MEKVLIIDLICFNQKKMKKALILFCLQFLVSCSYSQNSIEGQIGKKAQKIIEEATNVWAYELKPGATPDHDHMLLAGVVVEERIGLMSTEQIAPLLEALKSDGSFNWIGLENRIPFTPEVGFEFSKSGKVVVVMLDFDADEIGIKYGLQLYRFEFDNAMRSRLLSWLKSTFSYQASFQKLK